MTCRLRRVISGGQTGVDRIALERAREAGLEIGGWCPPRRAAEDGVIPHELPLRETPRERSEQAPHVARSLRTEWNVRDADGTLLLAPRGLIDPGCDWTRECARLHSRPLLELDPLGPISAAPLCDWLDEHSIVVLNVAGPSLRSAPENADAASRLLAIVFGHGSNG